MEEQFLVESTIRWAAGLPYDEAAVKTAKRRLAAENHRRYFDSIPAYRKHSLRQGCNGSATFDDIASHLMISDEYFKSYNADLIESRRYGELEEWIARISTCPAMEPSAGNLDEWFDGMAARDLHVVFSSGTSGHMSFVPRDLATWDDFLNLPLIYMPMLLARKGIVRGFRKTLLRAAARVLAPSRILKLVKKFGLRDYDGIFLGFAGGNQGIQLAGRELARLTATAEFLYPLRMTPEAVRALITRTAEPAARRAAEELLRHTVWEKSANYDRVIRTIQASRRKLIIFGTPYLLKELCETLRARGVKLALPRGSQVVYGGGWKSFAGERLSEGALLELIEQRLGVSPSHVSEGYSMTEIQGVMMRCSHGRYHVPPFLEAVLYDRALRPKPADANEGTLGLIDPFARSYPGFLITGDDVRLRLEGCECGLRGPAIENVQRTPGKEVKGCGGIMAAVNA